MDVIPDLRGLDPIPTSITLFLQSSLYISLSFFGLTNLYICVNTSIDTLVNSSQQTRSVV